MMKQVKYQIKLSPASLTYPCTIAVPVEGGTSPLNMLRRVVLPAPLCPKRHVICPSYISRDKSGQKLSLIVRHSRHSIYSKSILYTFPCAMHSCLIIYRPFKWEKRSTLSLKARWQRVQHLYSSDSLQFDLLNMHCILTKALSKTHGQSSIRLMTVSKWTPNWPWVSDDVTTIETWT